MKTLSRLGLLLCVLVAGCISSSPPSRFYNLTPVVAEAEQDSFDVPSELVGVGPIHLPRYLMRPQMVTRTDGNRMIIDEFARWADGLDLQAGRAITENLTLLCGSTLFLPFPWRDDFKPDLRLIADVTRFEANTDGVVELDIRWAIARPRTGTRLSVHESRYRSPADASDPGSVAAGMSDVIAQLSRDAAAALKAAGEEAAVAGGEAQQVPGG